MSNTYITAEKHLPNAPGTETVLQVRDAETKEIFHSRARVAKDPGQLEQPEPLSVVKGPHETTKEQWYIEFVDETEDVEDRLERLLEDQQERSNIVNTRSSDLNVLLGYLADVGEYDSMADAARALLFAGLAEEHPSLLETYADCKAEFETDPLQEVLETE
ncbi:hypothetical protein [Natronorubrum sulfidifaciens]|uniref:UbiD operon protein n=1 Tax=Natronorubrum sulfidifaciens JCM 14089 TaxID=1230460 RepID=L9W9D6_9EURY|nr:hypothetical protein [Natronorubrum sulfidifaciens]ELY46085.1 hypothetical protein C495_07580 [Natronorubrum sulfidifaciens JCM 14089]